ncbi:MAG: hypothetical protein QW220_03045 [Candidatus Bathyarchaeia archaeon]
MFMDLDAVRKVFLPRREDCLHYLRSKMEEGVRYPYRGSSRVWKDGSMPKEVYAKKSMRKVTRTGSASLGHT